MLEPAAGSVDPWRERSLLWIRLAVQTCDPIGDPNWSSPFLKDCNLWKDPSGVVPEEPQPVRRTHTGEVCEEPFSM